MFEKKCPSKPLEWLNNTCCIKKTLCLKSALQFLNFKIYHTQIFLRKTKLNHKNG